MKMTLRTPLGRARGLGSAKEGVGHHWTIIVTSVGLIPLSLWLVYSLIHLAGGDYTAFKSWVSQTCNASLLILTLLMILHHAVTGMSMVIEDYISDDGKKFASLVASKVLGAFLAVYMTVSILKVAIGG
jgi:succinate dehydrogenase / fumarate reductase, membrane anchor subunit